MTHEYHPSLKLEAPPGVGINFLPAVPDLSGR